MDSKLSEQTQATMDALTLAQTQAALVSKGDEQAARVLLAWDYSHVDDDIAHVIGKLRYMKLLAERRGQDEAQMSSIDATEPDRIPD